MFMCRDCGIEINEGEYNTFGVCDDCWDKSHPQNMSKANAYSLSAEVRAARELCEIYFKIASDVLGEDEVRKKRDIMIKNKISEHFA